MGSVTSLQCVERLFDPDRSSVKLLSWSGALARREVISYIYLLTPLRPTLQNNYSAPVSLLQSSCLCPQTSQSAFVLSKTISDYQPYLSSLSPCLINLTRPINWRSMLPRLAKTAGRLIWSVCTPREGTMTTEPSLHYLSCIAALPTPRLSDCSPLLPVSSSTLCRLQSQ